ncbi:MAG: SDR family oxidoreductase [Acidobacteriota bacterium]
MEGGDYTGSTSAGTAATEDLRGRTVLVTGGARRVGAAIARRLAARGARVAIHYHSSAREADALVEELGRGAASFQADLSSPTGPGNLLSRCADVGLSPDAIVQSAASFLKLPLAETTAEQWDAVMAMNLRALFLLARDYGDLRGPQGGQIVAIADSGAHELWPAYFAHCVSKAAVLSLVRALAKAMAPGFRVNAVVPGPVLAPDGTPDSQLAAIAERTLLGRMGEPRHVAQAVEFLLTCDYATGAVVDITGGAHLWRRPGG